MKASKQWIKKGVRRETRELIPVRYTTGTTGAPGVAVTLRQGEDAGIYTTRFDLDFEPDEARELAFDLLALARACEKQRGPFLHIDQARITGDGLGALPEGATVPLPLWCVISTPIGHELRTPAADGRSELVAETATREAARRLCDPVVLEALLSMKALLEEIRRRDGEGNVIPEGSTGVLHVQRAIAQLEGKA
jgi:hypothetical protein